MRVLAGLIAGGLCYGAAVAQQSQDQPSQRRVVETQPTTQPGGATARTAASPLDFTMKDIDGREVPLARYKGDVVLIVNVASKCGYTPQYKELQALYEKYAPRGLRILGFPANNFKQQEPGSNAEIREFCQKNYGVTFDLFTKVSVKGDDTCELYKFLTSAEKDPGHGGEIAWNFTKFLVDRDGHVRQRFEPKVKPDDPAVIKAVEDALSAKPTGAALKLREGT
jgi:glutathione peroxidase